MPSLNGKEKRDTSGRGGSILITSAPRSANVRPQSGPANTREKSTTLRPWRGPGIITSLQRQQDPARSPETTQGPPADQRTPTPVFGFRPSGDRQLRRLH